MSKNNIFENKMVENTILLCLIAHEKCYQNFIGTKYVCIYL